MKRKYYRFIVMLYRKRYTRLIYVLPTQAIANDLYLRLVHYAAMISDKIKIELFHGSESPDMPIFMGDLVVTTLDQFIYGYCRSTKLTGRHLELPSGGIAASFVVFDEAHLYHSEYTFSHLRAMLQILYESCIPFCLITATLPKSLRNDLLEEIDYLHLTSNETNSVRQITWSLVSTSVEENIDKACGKNKSLLVVVNTVQEAQILYQKFIKYDPVLLHSRFLKTDRDSHARVVLERFRRDGRGGLVISTQVLEAGLNVSAEVLLTEIAPADSLIQRIGRCVRFGNQGQVFIMKPDSSKKDTLLAPPYEDTVVKETLQFLENNPELNFNCFSEVMKFADILSYRCNDFQAQNSLIDLLQATMYADSRPENLQIRDGKSVRIYIPVKPDLPGNFPFAIDEIEARVISIPYKLIFRPELQCLIQANKPGNDEDDKKSGDDKPEYFQLVALEKEKPPMEINLAKEKPFVRKKDIIPFRTYLADPDRYSSEVGLMI